jgi:uroporphyrinogen decarboxylase
MRQAGRALPEYRALRECHSFLELARTPTLAAEVTLQPIRRFAFDAAIIFSDILVVPEAMGQGYHFAEEGGVRMDFVLRDRSDIERLQTAQVGRRLAYVAEALRLTRGELNGAAALVGFTGSPWTLANFMLQGSSGGGFHAALNLFRSDRAAYDTLASKLVDAIIEYLHLQCDAGAEALQIFDTLAGLLSDEDFEGASGQWIERIVAGVKGRVPIIIFAKGAHRQWPLLTRGGARVLGVDCHVDLGSLARELPPTIAVQGNLDPSLLETKPEVVRQQTTRILESMRGRPGHIFNLGHGVPPTAKLDCIQELVNTVRTFS